ncbi:RAMP superfamily CRISPR-associated protein, partial [Desulfonauticus submarinus]
RGSAWKGALLKAAFKRLQRNQNELAKTYIKIYRLFGTGSEEFRKMDAYVKEQKEKFEKQLIGYVLFELGLKLSFEKDKSIIEQILDQIQNHMNLCGFKETSVHKGRAIFYPTYFDTLSLEVINPHNRKTKAGTQPIYYEVVPKETEGILQIVYVPFDGILLGKDSLNNQVKEDILFLKKLVEDTITEYGVGAKTKLGWGRGEIMEGKIGVNEEKLKDEVQQELIGQGASPWQVI